ncbi:hypothetical protein [Azospirillum sp.]|uniref:hypothetical protein n=1 Tax=Azospirillum sp. TaxID=34012 RepID=UPI003D7246D3
MKTLSLLFAIAVITLPTAVWSAEVRCTFQSRQTCDPTGCVPTDPTTSFVTLRTDSNQYGRCGGTKPCDWYPMTVQQSGAFSNIDFATGVQGAKMTQDGSLFIETVSLMDKVIVSYGRCNG